MFFDSGKLLECTVSGWHTCFNVIAVLSNILKLHRRQTVYTLQVLTLIRFLMD